uniref:Alpha-1,4-N-acetylglucosaminyltransferase n=1 Tax=Lygus hesperus TaxID=30085 RepID=A0A146M4C3_LYGHE
MKRLCYLCLFWMALSSIAVYTVLVSRVDISRRLFTADSVLYEHPDEFLGFNNVSGTPDGCYIVPNIVHFIRFGLQEFSFVDAVCLLAALKNQKPEKIYLHTDLPNFYGRHWKVILSTPGISGVIELKYMRVPDQIYGQTLNNLGWRKYHASDIARLQILMKYGGIYLDNDSYIVQSLDTFRKYEMAIGWRPGGNISNQVMVAHKNARFLREWLLTYKDHYDSHGWYYNAGIRPTQEVLSKRPELVHRVSRRFAEYHGVADMLYLSKSDAWMDHYAIHLYVNHMKALVRRNLSSEATYPVVFNEDNIRLYPVNFRDMVYDVYPINRTV